MRIFAATKAEYKAELATLTDALGEKDGRGVGRDGAKVRQTGGRRRYSQGVLVPRGTVGGPYGLRVLLGYSTVGAACSATPTGRYI
jgi:hypothetical protein